MKLKLNCLPIFGLILISFSANSQCSVVLAPTDPSCFGDCNGSILATPSGGVAPYTFQWVDDQGNPIGANTNQLNGLCTGTYAVQVTDANGCVPALSASVLSEPADIIFQSIVTTDAGCIPNQCIGSVQASALGATKYGLDGVINPIGDFQNLCAGNYTLMAGNAAGCEITETVIIQPEEGPVANFANIPGEMSLPDNEFITFNSSTNSTNYIWTVQGPNFDFTSTETDLNLELPFLGANYEVCLIALNKTTCEDTVCHFVEVRDEFTIWVPNSFTPDADEFNNTFDPVISNVDGQAYDFFVFDRWGQLVFESHDLEQGWDGTLNGNYVKAGIYIWKIRLKSIDTDEFREYSGHVNMLK